MNFSKRLSHMSSKSAQCMIYLGLSKVDKFLGAQNSKMLKNFAAGSGFKFLIKDQNRETSHEQNKTLS